MNELKEVKRKIPASSHSVKNGVYLLRWQFFYKMGKTVETHRQLVLSAYPDATIIDSGEIYKAFRGGSSVANSSHWFVRFTLPAPAESETTK